MYSSSRGSGGDGGRGEAGGVEWNQIVKHFHAKEVWT